MRLKEDEKRTEVRGHNAQRQRKKDGEFATLASEDSLLLQSRM